MSIIRRNESKTRGELWTPPSPRNSFALIGPDPSRSLNTIGQVRDGFLSESDMAGPDEVRNYPD